MTIFEIHQAAGKRYADAVAEFRESWADLAALDRILASPGFGEAPAVVSLRHAIFAPNVSGSFADDIAAAFAIRNAAFTDATTKGENK